MNNNTNVNNTATTIVPEFTEKEQNLIDFIKGKSFEEIRRLQSVTAFVVSVRNSAVAGGDDWKHAVKFVNKVRESFGLAPWPAGFEGLIVMSYSKKNKALMIRSIANVKLAIFDGVTVNGKDADPTKARFDDVKPEESKKACKSIKLKDTYSAEELAFIRELMKKAGIA